jgi:hypothetical protein
MLNILNNADARISLSNIEKDILSESSFFYNTHLLFESKAVEYEGELSFLSPLYINQRKTQGALGSATFGFIVKTKSPREAEDMFWETAVNLSEDLNTSEFDIYSEMTHVSYSLLPFPMALKRMNYMKGLIQDNLRSLSRVIDGKNKNMKFDEDSNAEKDDENEKVDNIRDMMKEINEAIEDKKRGPKTLKSMKNKAKRENKTEEPIEENVEDVIEEPIEENVEDVIEEPNVEDVIEEPIEENVEDEDNDDVEEDGGGGMSFI